MSSGKVTSSFKAHVSNARFEVIRVTSQFMTPLLDCYSCILVETFRVIIKQRFLLQSAQNAARKVIGREFKLDEQV